MAWQDQVKRNIYSPENKNSEIQHEKAREGSARHLKHDGARSRCGERVREGAGHMGGAEVGGERVDCAVVGHSMPPLIQK